MATFGLTEDFATGARETERTTIVNLLYYTKAKFLPVRVAYAGYLYTGFIDAIYEDSLLIVFEDFTEHPERRVVLNFEALNRFYGCQSQVVGFSGKGIRIAIPRETFRLSRRRYPRIRFDDLFMRFIILYSPILQTREEEKLMESRFAHFFAEVTEDEPSLRIVNQMFLKTLSLTGSNFSIRLFGDRDRREFSVPEDYLYRKVKAFYIGAVSRIDSYITESPDGSYGNYSEVYAAKLKNEGKTAAANYIEEVQKEDLKDFLVSYVLIPLQFFGRPSGYVRLETNLFDKKGITALEVKDLATVAELYSYAITKIQIRRSHFDANSIQTRVVNISLSGCLAEITDHAVYWYLQRHNRIKMRIPIIGEELEIFGEIKRFYEENGYYYLGILFFKSKPDDFLKLEEFIYQNLQYQFY